MRGGRRERGAGTGSQQAWPGTVPRPRAAQAGRASSQGRLWASGCGSLCSQVGAGPEAGEAWRGRTPGRLCYQGVSLRKGADPCPAPPSLAPSRPRNHSRVGESNASGWQPRNPHRMRGLGVLGQAAASSSVARPRARRAHAHTHTLSLIVCFGEQSQEQRKHTATKPDTDGPSYHHTAPRGHMTGQPLGLSLSLSYTHRSVLACASTDKHVHIRLPHTDDTRCCERPRERLTGQGTEGEGGSPDCR